MTRRRNTLVVLVGLMVVAGCASTKVTPSSRSSQTTQVRREVNPAGDIPDNQAFVPFTAPSRRYRVSIPEGWSRTAQGPTTSFTDKLNSIVVTSHPAASAPTVTSVRSEDLVALRHADPKLGHATVTLAKRHAGTVVLLTYQAPGAPDPVTGKAHDEAVETFYYWRTGMVAVVTLRAPVGADNVDPWRKVSDSFTWLSQ